MTRTIAAKTPPLSTPHQSGASGSYIGGMPLDMVGQACKRMSALVIPLGLLALVGTVVNLLFPTALGWTEGCSTIGVVIYGSIFLLSGVVLALLRKHHDDPEKIINAAVVYQVMVSFAISYAELQLPAPSGRLIGGISFVAVLIVLFPMLIPIGLNRSVLVGLLAATTGPAAALVLTGLTKRSLPGGAVALVAYLPSYLVVGLVAVPVALLQRMGQQMARARRLGSYELRELLGYGGMGEVWSAEHQLLRRPAAVKLITSEALGTSNQIQDQIQIQNQSENETAARRFEREAQATADLTSPHTVQLYDFGITREGTFYYVMELLDGYDLEAIVKRFGPMPSERVVSLLRQACDSLWDAHQSGLVHRDIKPANIYTCHYGHRYDHVKVLDFGLVKAVSPNTLDATLTGAGTITGTPAFIAPEMVTGSDHDGRADLYALGCVGYWLLTGELVFDHPNAMQMMMAHAGEDPIPPSLRTELPVNEGLEKILLKCLAKAPEDRFETAQDLAVALDGVQLDESWSQPRAQRWWSVHAPQGERAVEPRADDDEPTRQLLPKRLLPATAERR
jgi:eukaryotic-like serine/threonine-protein kinase